MNACNVIKFIDIKIICLLRYSFTGLFDQSMHSFKHKISKISRLIILTLYFKHFFPTYSTVVSICNQNLILKFEKNLKNYLIQMPFFIVKVIKAFKGGPRSDLPQTMNLYKPDLLAPSPLLNFFNVLKNVQLTFHIDIFMKS